MGQSNIYTKEKIFQEYSTNAKNFVHKLYTLYTILYTSRLKPCNCVINTGASASKFRNRVDRFGNF